MSLNSETVGCTYLGTHAISIYADTAYVSKFRKQKNKLLTLQASVRTF